MKKRILLLRKIAIIEGLSFLILLGIAMPLKYVWGQPLAVRIFGMAHGALFIALVGMLLFVTRSAHWPLSRAALIFVAALIPFGPWLIDRRVMRYAEEVTTCPLQ